MRIAAVLVMIFIYGSEATACERPNMMAKEHEFTGRLVALSGLTPPDYVGTADADKLEYRWYLRLEHPICDVRNKPQFLIEMHIHPGDFARYRQLLDSDVTVAGDLGEWLSPIYDVPFTMIVRRLAGVQVKGL